MATSGSIDFNMTANEVVTAAFRKLKIRPAETPLEPEEIQDGLQALNVMLKSWSKDLHLWIKTEAVLFVEPSTSKYLLGTARAARADDFVGTSTTASLAALATSIPVSDTTGMTVGDQIGIELDDLSRHWTTIDTIPSSTSLTITTGVPSVAASGVSVYTYTNLLERPLRIDDYARRQTFGQNNEIEITKSARNDYFTQTNKVSTGTITSFYYSPQRDNGEFYIWQPVSTAKELVKFTFERTLEDIDVNNNNLDLPVEWLETVIYNLAVRLTDEYDVPADIIQSVTAKAGVFLDNLLGWDDEANDLQVQPWTG